jgi:hypothetical protein
MLVLHGLLRPAPPVLLYWIFDRNIRLWLDTNAFVSAFSTGRHATGCGASSRPLCFDALKIMQVGERRARDNTPKKLIAGGLSCRFLYFHYNPARVPNADGLR